jgi:hypothetical protein
MTEIGKTSLGEPPADRPAIARKQPKQNQTPKQENPFSEGKTKNIDAGSPIGLPLVGTESTALVQNPNRKEFWRVGRFCSLSRLILA